MKIFIGCSSREELNQIYIDSATKLAEELSKRNHDLICGGIDGTMKILHDIFKQSNRTITLIGVNGYFPIEENSPNTYNYDTIRERKDALTRLADFIIFLPGGLGSMDEIFTAIESKRAKEHNKPIIIININNYYVGIIMQLNTMYKEKFANKNDQQLYHIVNNIEDALTYIEDLGDKYEL